MSEPVDLAAVASDDALIEDLRAGAQPPTGDQVAAALAAWREEVAAPPVPHQNNTQASRTERRAAFRTQPVPLS